MCCCWCLCALMCNCSIYPGLKNFADPFVTPKPIFLLINYSRVQILGHYICTALFPAVAGTKLIKYQGAPALHLAGRHLYVSLSDSQSSIVSHISNAFCPLLAKATKHFPQQRLHSGTTTHNAAAAHLRFGWAFLRRQRRRQRCWRLCCFLRC